MERLLLLLQVHIDRYMVYVPTGYVKNGLVLEIITYRYLL